MICWKAFDRFKRALATLSRAIFFRVSRHMRVFSVGGSTEAAFTRAARESSELAIVIQPFELILERARSCLAALGSIEYDAFVGQGNERQSAASFNLSVTDVGVKGRTAKTKDGIKPLAKLFL